MARKGMMVGDSEHNIQKEMLAVGAAAPDFSLIANDLSGRSLADYAGKVKIISVIPSIDTGVCSDQTRRFNAEAAGLDETVVLTVSADMPFALGRFCGSEGIENTETLSTHRDMAFADEYGVHDTDWRICQRAVFVLDRDNILRHAEYVPVIGDEVNFDAALAKAKELA
ncbi:MAG: thiol peroxidase [Chloroflexota bacterium]|nr:thiol peroxidase [Chloroflexota bacterium]MDE2946395.1 thiol peroxidase [Chloroflexota bacterium]